MSATEVQRFDDDADLGITLVQQTARLFLSGEPDFGCALRRNPWCTRQSMRLTRVRQAALCERSLDLLEVSNDQGLVPSDEKCQLFFETAIHEDIFLILGSWSKKIICLRLFETCLC